MARWRCLRGSVTRRLHPWWDFYPRCLFWGLWDHSKVDRAGMLLNQAGSGPVVRWLFTHAQLCAQAQGRCSWHLQRLWCATHGSPSQSPKLPLFSDNPSKHPSSGRTVLGSPQAHLPLGDWTTPFMIKRLRTWIWVWILPALYTLTSSPHTTHLPSLQLLWH